MNLPIRSLLKKYKLYLYLGLGYTLIACVVNYPFIRHFFTALPSAHEDWYIENDIYYYPWAVWHVKEMLLNPSVGFWHNNLLFFPEGMSPLRVGMPTLYALVSVPFQFLFGIPLTQNIRSLLSFPITSLGMFLLVDYLIRDKKAAFLAGLVFVLHPFRNASTQYQFLLFDWVPYYVLFLLKTFRETKLRNAVLTGLSLAAVVLTNLYYAVFCILFSGMLFFYDLCTVPKRLFHLSFLKRMGILAGVFLSVTSWFVFPMIIEITRLDPRVVEEKGNLDRIATYSGKADVLNYFLPGESSLIFPGHRIPNMAGMFLGNGMVLLSLFACIKLRKDRDARFWAWTALLFFLLSLGPILWINGKGTFTFKNLQVVFPMPFILVSYIPFINGLRTTSNYAIMTVFSLTVLSAYAYHYIRTAYSRARASNKLQIAILAFLSVWMWAEYLRPIPPLYTRDVMGEISEFYKIIEEDNSECTVLEVPTYRLNWRTIYPQMVHHKPILGGHGERIPAKYQWNYFDQIPVISVLSFPGATIPNLNMEGLRDQLSSTSDLVMGFFRVKYIVVHKDVLRRDPVENYHLEPEGLQKLDRFVQEIIGARKIYEDDATWGYILDKKLPPWDDRLEVREDDEVVLTVRYPESKKKP